jgi:hypothetical protein
VREGVAPFRYDYFAFPMLGDPAQPYGRVDVGWHDELFLGDGWYAAEALADGLTLRWTGAAADLLLPLDHASPLLVQLRVKALTYEASPSAQLAVRVNGRSFGPFTVAGDWQRVDFPTGAATWRAGVNRLELVWLNAAVPAQVGAGSDGRQLGGAVDYVRIQVPK